MTERILQGPFYTRGQAARWAGIPADLVIHRPDLLRIDGEWLPEVYFSFQFDAHGVKPGIGRVVQMLKKTYRDIEIADWLVRPHPKLNTSPLHFLKGNGSVEKVLDVAEVAGPRRDELEHTSVPGPRPAVRADQKENVTPLTNSRPRRTGRRGFRPKTAH